MQSLPKRIYQELTEARILVLDDEPANVQLLERVLESAEFQHVRGINDSRQALPLFDEFQPDLILLDLVMPHMDGYELLGHFTERAGEGSWLPILVLTADITARAKQKALSLGARDFLTKPFDVTEVVLRIRNLLETRRLHLLLRDQNANLELRVQERTRELQQAQQELLERLAVASDYRDDDTGAHTRRVGWMSEHLALALGVPADDARVLGLAARFHDVGKIGVPDAILRKPGPLTTEEFAVMKEHTQVGAKILCGSQFRILQVAETIARTHHERYDGRGYGGLIGEDIPLEGRIVAVVDAFDAMVNDRPYRKALPVEVALRELESKAGSQFDPRVVAAFLNPASYNLQNLAAATNDTGWSTDPEAGVVDRSVGALAT